ncbi:6-pyruvoyl tetrahydropterin synthase [Thalassoglobus neptunius]|uniref:6-carboxy-5,6,7,8-tetrahydropterin synthase n=1 Tax=Thalassoglobus neptunius TaxID=1938619 RepID=A0A5C5X2R6_9PLAN|nr:6-pyruvoyl tetrahydropterin synthase family protein [Thalassoglobus neptunius]TWT57347.1 6-pyruvoyl tetrahydropterin synthase [Thalassoglobus neptunius]
MSQTRSFAVDVTKDHLVFSAAHFITIGDDLCERLHGHNWRVAARVEGDLDGNGFVFDFIALRDELQKWVDRLDHRMLLPTQHRQISVEPDEKEVHVRYRDRRWVFPLEECVLLPIEQTTAELLASWIADQLIETLETSPLTSLSVKVEENFGQWATCRVEF